MIKRFEIWHFEDCLGLTKHDYATPVNSWEKNFCWIDVLKRLADATNEKLAKDCNTSFKEGDRVAVYYQDTRLTGTVTKYEGMHSGQFKVFIDGNDGALSVYPFECRKLKLKRNK